MSGKRRTLLVFRRGARHSAPFHFARILFSAVYSFEFEDGGDGSHEKKETIGKYHLSTNSLLAQSEIQNVMSLSRDSSSNIFIKTEK